MVSLLSDDSRRLLLLTRSSLLGQNVGQLLEKLLETIP